MGKYVTFLKNNHQLPKGEMRTNLEVSKYFIQQQVIILFSIFLSLRFFWVSIWNFLSPLSGVLGLSLELEIWGEKERKRRPWKLYIYCSITSSKVPDATFFEKKDIGIIDKGNLQLQGKGKNSLPYFFFFF